MYGFLNFKNKHAVCDTSAIASVYGAGHIYNIQVISETLDNGTIVSKGDYVAPDYYKEAAASATFEGEVTRVLSNGRYLVEVVACDEKDLLVCQVAVPYYDFTTPMKDEAQFYNAKGDIVRSYTLKVGDRYGLSAEGFGYEVQVGDSVVVDSINKKLKKKGS